MRKILPLLLFWLTLSVIWGIFRLFESTELISELIAKPFIWLGITALFIKLNVIPKKVINDLRDNYLTKTPFVRIFILPTLAITLYFILINFK